MTKPLRARLGVARDWRGEAISAEERVSVELALDTGALEVVIDAPYHGDAPPLGPAGSTDRLWEHEVVELFLLGADELYTEIELGPHGHYLALRLEGMRHVVERHLPVRYEARIDGPRWNGRAVVARGLVPEPIVAANAYAIHGSGEARRYLAAHPVPGTAPDFHRLDCFRPVEWRSGEP